MPARTKNQARGEALVEKVLAAALEEISQSGVERLSIEAVAARAGVNKTSIWRRWSKPEDLAISAIQRVSDNRNFTNTGSLRGDLIDYMKRFREVCRLPGMLSVVRLKFRSTPDGEPGHLLAAKFAEADEEALVIFTRAIARGELAEDADIGLLRDMMLGVLYYLVLLRYDSFQGDRIDEAVGHLLAGLRRS